LVGLAQEIAGVLAAIHHAGLVRGPVAGVDGGGATADGDALPGPRGAEVVRGDRAPDLVCRKRGSLLVGLWEDDREVGWSVRVEKPHGVSVADGLAEPFGHLPEQSFDLDLLQLFVDVLR